MTLAKRGPPWGLSTRVTFENSLRNSKSTIRWEDRTSIYVWELRTTIKVEVFRSIEPKTSDPRPSSKSQRLYLFRHSGYFNINNNIT